MVEVPRLEGNLFDNYINDTSVSELLRIDYRKHII